MTPSRSFLVAVLVLASIVVAHARPAPVEGELDQLRWLAGYWRADSDAGIVEEVWMAPERGLMLGLNRSVPAAERPPAFEYLRVEERADGVFYVASPGGRGTTDFRLDELTSTRAVFTNPEHDFPQRIEYERDGDRLTARALGGDGRGPSWTFARVAELGD